MKIFYDEAFYLHRLTTDNRGNFDNDNGDNSDNVANVDNNNGDNVDDTFQRKRFHSRR